MYQALQQAYDEIGIIDSDRPLTEKMTTLLRNGFSESLQNLNKAASVSKNGEDSKTLQKLCEGMIAGERIINHIWNKQPKTL